MYGTTCGVFFVVMLVLFYSNLVFMWVLGTELQSSCWEGKHSSKGSALLSLRLGLSLGDFAIVASLLPNRTNSVDILETRTAENLTGKWEVKRDGVWQC